MAKEMRINLDVDTTKLQRILEAVSKHTGALVKELAEIDRMVICDCGSEDFTKFTTAIVNSVEYKCNECGEPYAVNKQVEETE